MVDVDPDGDGLLLVVDLLNILDISPEVNDNGRIGQRKCPYVAGHRSASLALKIHLLALLSAIAYNQLYQMPFLLLIMPQILLTH